MTKTVFTKKLQNCKRGTILNMQLYIIIVPPNLVKEKDPVIYEL